MVCSSLQVTPPISLFHSLSLSLSLTHTHTHTHTDVPSSGGVRSGDKATRGRSRRTTALTVLARGETESENGVFLQVTPPISLFHSLSLSLTHTHTHTHTQMSHHQVVFVLETRQPEVAVGEPLLLQFQQEGRLRVRMVCSSLQVTPPISLFYSLPFSHAHEHACMCAHTHTQMSHRQVVFVLETRQPEVGVGEPLLLQFQQEGKLRVRMVCSSRSPSHFTISLPLSLSLSHTHTHTHTHTHRCPIIRWCSFWRQGNQRLRWRSR